MHSEDIDMDESEPIGHTLPTFREWPLIIVLDTNVLIDDLRTIRQFVADVEKVQIPVRVVVPGIVLVELDKQKNRPHLRWFSSTASSWIRDKLRPPSTNVVRKQKDEETCKLSGKWNVRQQGEVFINNDSAILDCCRFFQRETSNIFLWSKDINLCINAITYNIHTVELPGSPSHGGELTTRKRPSPRSSRQLAQVLSFGAEQLIAFAPAPTEPDYTGHENVRPETSRSDRMDVDDDTDIPSTPMITHLQALDALFIQVVRHFASLLVDLVGRVGGHALEDPVADNNGTTASRFAPKWKRAEKLYTTWDVEECLSYLDSKRPRKETYPKLATFLRMPYTGQGSKCGREWATESWSTALEGLRQLALAWKDTVILEDLEELKWHREALALVKRH